MSPKWLTLLEAGSLPSATLGKEPPSNPLLVKAALPSAKFRALGKDLTPSADGRRRLIFFKNSLPSATAPALGKEICFFKPLCRVPQHRHSAKGVFYFFFKLSLPSAMTIALGKENLKKIKKTPFAECRWALGKEV